MRSASLILLAALAACAEPAREVVDADVSAARVIALSTPALSWEELRVHPVLLRRPCAVHTLVNEDAVVVGYCDRGRRCRTNDWRPVLDGCEAGSPLTPAPAGSALEIAGRR